VSNGRVSDGPKRVSRTSLRPGRDNRISWNLPEQTEGSIILLFIVSGLQAESISGPVRTGSVGYYS
jgi:hypothetical protein